MCVEDGIDEVVDACPEVLLQNISLEVLVEVQFVFVIDDALHTQLYITSLINTIYSNYNLLSQCQSNCNLLTALSSHSYPYSS